DARRTHKPRCTSFHHRQSDPGWVARGFIDTLGGGLVVLRRGLEDVRDKFLGVPIIEGKPGTLDLDHDPVSLLEGMIVSMQVDSVFLALIRTDRGGILESSAKPAAENLLHNH